MIDQPDKIPCHLLFVDDDSGYSNVIEVLIKILEHRLSECPDKQQQRLWEERIQRMIRIMDK